MAKVGRPLELTPFIKEVAKHYTENYKDYDDLIPSIAGLSIVVGVNRATLKDWRNRGVDEEFTNIYDNLMAEQERTLLRGGLSKQFSGAITAMILTKHGYANKTDLTSSDGSMTPQAVTAIERRVVKPKAKK